MEYAVQATTHYQTYPTRPPGADLPPKKVCNLGPMAPRSRHVGRPETDWPRVNAMTVLATGLAANQRHEEAIDVMEALLALGQRRGWTPKETYWCLRASEF